MKLLVIRHAPAEDREIFASTGEPDEARPLTEYGRKKMRKAAQGLNAVMPYVDVLATSPLVRCRETAQIISDAYSGLEILEAPVLTPGHTPEKVTAWLKTQKKHGVIAIVGHEPDLGRVVSWLLTGHKKSILDFKKGSACLLDFSDAASVKVAQGKARLIWMLHPAQLRALRARG